MSMEMKTEGDRYAHGKLVSLSPCGRRWLARSKSGRAPGEGRTIHGAKSLTRLAHADAFARHSLPQGQREKLARPFVLRGPPLSRRAPQDNEAMARSRRNCIVIPGARKRDPGSQSTLALPPMHTDDDPGAHALGRDDGERQRTPARQTRFPLSLRERMARVEEIRARAGGGIARHHRQYPSPASRMLAHSLGTLSRKGRGKRARGTRDHQAQAAYRIAQPALRKQKARRFRRACKASNDAALRPPLPRRRRPRRRPWPGRGAGPWRARPRSPSPPRSR